MNSTPSNEDIDLLVRAYLGDCGPQANRIYAFVTAVLAKWGTPQPANLGFTIENRAGIDVLVREDGGCQPATSAEVAIWKALAAAQKPVVREPLTDEQLLLLRFATTSLFHLFERWNKKEIPHRQLMDEMRPIIEHVIRRTVDAHGINGGQHGTDT